MKVHIKQPPSWFGPYQLAELILFWNPNGAWAEMLGEWLAYGHIEPDPDPGAEPRPLFRDRKPTLLHRFLTWIDGVRQPTHKVKIDPWDTWSMDHTLAHIVLPMLKDLKQRQQGAPPVDDLDVPEHIQSTAAPPLTEKDQDCGATDEYFHDRWLWVLDEMIFAFETKAGELEDWDAQFFTGKPDLVSAPISWDSAGKPTMYELQDGPNHTMEIDWEGHNQYQERISNGFRLFGKYYEALWC